MISDDAARGIAEFLVEAAGAEYDLGALMYAKGVYPQSVEVTVNGLLLSQVENYQVTTTSLVLNEALLPGDTLRICALEDLS